jgi:phosphoribosylaminoimidazole-succinocarboxamide synthase
VYWLTREDSQRLINTRGYDVAADADLAVMVISDRLSAFECLWTFEGNIPGIPGKGAALNAVSNHWFQLFKEQGLAPSHILDVPHPLVWIVQKARPVMIEAIARQYLTGSMWRAYENGTREFCGIQLADGLKRDQKLAQLLITPSTKGIIKNVPGVPEVDDVNISRADLENNFEAFKFQSRTDIAVYERLLSEGFALISEQLSAIDQIFVDTKFEFGYVTNAAGEDQLIYMDEVGTPDSSRIWDGPLYRQGKVVEKSKEAFRQALLNHFPEPDILVNKDRMEERYALARNNILPGTIMQDVADTYRDIAEKITGTSIPVSDDPKAEIIDILATDYDLIRS